MMSYVFCWMIGYCKINNNATYPFKKIFIDEFFVKFYLSLFKKRNHWPHLWLHYLFCFFILRWVKFVPLAIKKKKVLGWLLAPTPTLWVCVYAKIYLYHSCTPLYNLESVDEWVSVFQCDTRKRGFANQDIKTIASAFFLCCHGCVDIRLFTMFPFSFHSYKWSNL